MIAFHGFQILQKKIIFFVLFLRYTYGGKEKIGLQIFQHCTFLNFFLYFFSIFYSAKTKGCILIFLWNLNVVEFY